ncbi:hypothetical protein EZV62_022103 [Acer yangbiense]|uniref:Cytochrome P450 n=1 Tax=Acer yangbiense TaxID=1000413 RepID=A0A5C7H7H7_9ROSI|nr:hypothetical protein EZV62_022103 [Acer yangbiense]
MKKRFGALGMNVIVRMIAGKRYLGTDEEESSRFQKALGDFFPLVGLVLVSDTVPFLGWLDVVNGYIGFHIPAGTWLFVNLWKLHRDPSIWLNPSEFIPERFLNYHANLDARGQHFEYLPFSSGRRKCPGISFELQVLHLTLARLFHAFELGTVSDTIVDMSEGPGLTIPKATPLEVIVTPRLPSMLYDFNKQEE